MSLGRQVKKKQAGQTNKGRGRKQKTSNVGQPSSEASEAEIDQHTQQLRHGEYTEERGKVPDDLECFHPAFT